MAPKIHSGAQIPRHVMAAPGSRRARLAAWILGLIASTAGWASDSAPPPADPDLATEGMRPLGPVLMRPYVLVKDAGWDDNVRFERGRGEGDYTLTLAPGVRMLLPTGTRGGILAAQEFGYVAYRSEDAFDHWDSRTRVRGILLLRPVAFSLEERYESVQQPPTADVLERVRQYLQALTAGVDSRGSGRLRYRVSVSRRIFGYGGGDLYADQVRLALDRDESLFSAGLETRILPKTIFTLDGLLQRSVYDDPGQRRDNSTRTLLPGLRFDPSARLQGRVRIGWTDLSVARRANGDFRGVVGDGDIGLKLGSRGRASLAFERSLPVSVVGTNIYDVTTSWSLSYEHFLSRRLSAEASYGLGWSSYPDPVSGPGGRPFHREDHLATSRLALRWRTAGGAIVEAFFQHLGIDSTDDSVDRSRNFYGFTSHLQF